MPNVFRQLKEKSGFGDLIDTFWEIVHDLTAFKTYFKDFTKNSSNSDRDFKYIAKNGKRFTAEDFAKQNGYTLEEATRILEIGVSDDLFIKNSDGSYSVTKKWLEVEKAEAAKAAKKKKTSPGKSETGEAEAKAETKGPRGSGGSEDTTTVSGKDLRSFTLASADVEDDINYIAEHGAHPLVPAECAWALGVSQAATIKLFDAGVRDGLLKKNPDGSYSVTSVWMKKLNISPASETPETPEEPDTPGDPESPDEKPTPVPAKLVEIITSKFINNPGHSISVDELTGLFTKFDMVENRNRIMRTVRKMLRQHDKDFIFNRSSKAYTLTTYPQPLKTGSLDPWLGEISQQEAARLMFMHRASITNPSVISPFEEV